MSEGGELVHFHDWRAARDRKAATRRLWRSRCSGLVTVPLSIGLATLVLAAGTSILPHPAAHSGAEVQHRLLTYRIWCPRARARVAGGEVLLAAKTDPCGRRR